MTAAEVPEAPEVPGGPIVAVTHEHALRLVAVHLEDGATTREFHCETCLAVWFS